MLDMNTGMIWQTSSTSSADTERLGELLGQNLKGGEVIELRSDLGGGKTTLVRGLARGIGSEDTVASPTFTLNKIYKGRGGVELHHFDFYRLSEPGIIADQLAESIDEPKVITVIEWSDVVKNVLPEHRITIALKPVETDANERAVAIHYPEKSRGLITKAEAEWQQVRP